MIRCPQCNHEELEGALFCTKCGALLETDSPLSTKTFTPGDTGEYQPSIPPSLLEISVTGVGATLYLSDFQRTLPLDKGRSVVLGRAVESEPLQPDIDLTPFDAYRLGVSRRHARLEWQGSRLTITDLNSSNGTRVNGQRIPAGKAVDLHHGDEIRLGKLRIQILLEGE